MSTTSTTHALVTRLLDPVMRIVLIVLSLLVTSLYAADLPKDAQREVDAYEATVAKADAERQTKVNAAVDKAVKALDSVSRKAATAEDRRAIDDKILEIKKARSVDDLLNEGKKENPWVGSYTIGSAFWGEVRGDGTATLRRSDEGKWTIDKGRLAITWQREAVTDTLDQPDKDGLIKMTNSKGETYTLKKEKR